MSKLGFLSAFHVGRSLYSLIKRRRGSRVNALARGSANERSMFSRCILGSSFPGNHAAGP